MQAQVLLLASLLVVRAVPMVDTDIIKTSTITPLTTEDDYEEARLLFFPADLSTLNVTSSVFVQLNLSSKVTNYANFYSKQGVRFFIGLKYDTSDSKLVSMMSILPSQRIKYEPSRRYNLSYHLFWELKPKDDYMDAVPIVKNDTTNLNGFILSLISIGYPKLQFDFVKLFTDNTTDVIFQEEYRVKAIRQPRTVDLAFTIVITLVSALNIFAIGCLSEVPVLRSQLKKSIIPVCIASVTQYVITPLLAFGLVKAGRVLPEIAVGILLCSCVPGGGLGHLIVLITGNANPELSVAINFLQIFVPLGSVPLWLYSLGQLLENGVGRVEVPTHYMVLCLAVLLFPYILGVVTRRFKACVAEAILNWLIKPLLLLFMILFVTLGLYINAYAMGVMDKTTLAMAGLVPSLGFCIGGALTLVSKQGKASAKSVAIEAAIMNCLAVVAAAKFTMPQPDSDMACAGAMGVLLFTPVPFVGMLIFHKIKKKIMNFFENRKFEKEHHETILKSFGAITQNALQMSGMTPEQINARKAQERLNNFDKTLISVDDDPDGREPNQSFVQIKDGRDPTSVETVVVTQSNNRNYV